MKKFTLCLMMILTLIMIPGVILAAEPEAEIEGNLYPTLREAIAAVTDNTQTTIKLVRDVEDGQGFVIESGKNITIDFNNKTYNIAKDLVGSTGTETNGCQLLKDSNLTFKDGKLTTTIAKYLIQNYSNLTLENMNVDATKSDDAIYAMSNNNGDVEITGNTSLTIEKGKSAIEICWWPAGYPEGTRVTINTIGTITGDIEFGAYAYNVADEVKSNLTIENVNHKGKIVYNANETKELVKDEIVINGGTFSSSVLEFIDTNSGLTNKEENGINYVGILHTITGVDTEYGKVTPDKTEAVKGQTIELTVETKEGYKLKSLVVVDGPESISIDVTDSKTFEMPDANVSVIAIFEEMPVEPENPDSGEPIIPSEPQNPDLEEPESPDSEEPTTPVEPGNTGAMGEAEQEPSDDKETNINQDSKEEGKDDTPKTGSVDIVVYVSAIITVIALAGIVIVKKYTK